MQGPVDEPGRSLGFMSCWLQDVHRVIGTVFLVDTREK